MNKQLLILSLALAFAGCVSKNPILETNLMGDSAINNMSYDQIHSKLQHFDAKSHVGVLSNSAALARATPMTAPLIIAEETEAGKKQLRSEAETQKVIAERLKYQVNAKPCFLISIQTSGSIEVAQFKNWISKIKTKSGELIDVEFENLKGIDSVPTGRAGSWDYNVYQWENHTGACAKKNFNRQEDFSLILSSSFLKDIENLEIKWTFTK